jgi:hypothetical protein
VRRPALPLLLAAVLVVPSAPALAAGTGGIVVTPLGEDTPTAFEVEVPREGSLEVPFVVSNVVDGPRSARLYATSVERRGDEFAVGDPGSSRWVELADQEVALEAGESRDLSFTVRGGDLPDGEVLAAVVLEVRNGAVVQRASTLVRLSEGRVVPLPLLLVVLAVVLLLAAAAAVAESARRRRARGAG